MFLKSLRIENENGVIRHIPFHAGLNLIVDETPDSNNEATGNNVGKTTVLRLIDFCFGGSPKEIYTDPEDRKSEHQIVKNFLQKTYVLITLTLTSDLSNPRSEEIVIERNFLPRKGMIRRINGNQLTEEEFTHTLTEKLFPGQSGKKPSLGQLISHNIRYKDFSLTNTLRHVHPMTKDEEYEALHLYMLGCDFSRGDERQKLIGDLRVENAFKARLEAAGSKFVYETLLSRIQREIEKLNHRRASFNINPDFERDLQRLDEIKYGINTESSIIGAIKLRRNLLTEAVADTQARRFQVDTVQLKALYAEVSSRLSGVQKTFDELVEFHNKMVDEKSRYISRDIPLLEEEIANREAELSRLLDLERNLAAKLAKSGSLNELELVISELNEKHRLLGEYQTVIRQIDATSERIGKIEGQLSEIDGDLFSGETQSVIQSQVHRFNEFFSKISEELYDEQYALTFEIVKTRSGRQVYKFKTFNMNMSSGKKQGEISCFDIAYTLFADDENIPCMHFLLNDKKELMHDNQLLKIANLVEREKTHIQFVASMLRDKLPPELNSDNFIVLKLSQDDMLFNIESN
ncbi:MULTISPECIES: DUF2326 domain-containing protein [Ralstonia]|jgi:uncharacterized protein YydD (DUF2326 family)|uniref:DUF2326 domain-containing protein n=3 Tax=Ralstonia TaxID=48736 RepID=A0A848PCM0_9RALS|nr:MULTISPECIES: DUF2326 domain-containing protein [Ralstonia]ENZ76344.1 hypothetical protein OR214_03510 [Ralstonia pickettii OR214]MBL4777969.1 DUF2326 domain-containing protein [Ralstonia sp.]MBT2180922.1 DUF2326 domain-containing protein [Ralstonia pickettii]MCM3579047.1 DUF2326 domain-containing protein [Ralstonia pickettii]MDR9384498.1 DUF2326 domain-containing protein [Ralstonia sp. 11b]